MFGVDQNFTLERFKYIGAYCNLCTLHENNIFELNMPFFKNVYFPRKLQSKRQVLRQHWS